MSTNILTPVGRMVAGSVYEANTTDFQGNPLTVKTGPNAGQPRSEFFFAVAIQKGGETAWWETQWGQEIFQVAAQAWPNGEYGRPDFSWKIEDGDSTVPNKRNVAPCTKEGYPGHWVLKFSSGYAPGLYTMVHCAEPLQLVEPNAVMPGYYIQVAGSVAGNNNSSNPGIYLNHSMVCLMGYGDRIIGGPDASAVGFGGALPPGATTAPPAASGGFNPAMPQAAPTQPQAAPTAVPPAAPVAPPVAPMAAPVPAASSAPAAPGVPQYQTPQGQQFLNGNQ